MSSHLGKFLRGLAVLALSGASLFATHAANLEVGSGKTYATIQSALNAATDGDKVLVYSGTYDEQIVWKKSVDILEATGETAVWTNTVAGGGEPIHADEGVGIWDGIDVVLNAFNDQGTIFYTRFVVTTGTVSTPVTDRTYRNFHMSAGPNVSGTTKPFFHHDRARSRIQNVTIDMGTMNIGSVFHSQVGTSVSVTNCLITARSENFGWINNAGSESGLFINDCVFNNTKATGAYGMRALDGNIVVNNCVFNMNASGAGSAIFKVIGDNGASITATDCLLNAGTSAQTGYAIASVDAASNFINMTNCAGIYVANAANVYGVQAPNGGSFTFRHVTLSVNGGSAATTATAFDFGTGANGDGNVNLQNCLFSLPGSTAGVIKGEGLVTQTNGTNLRWLAGATPTGDLLNGSIVGGDPKFGADKYHLLPGSAAANAGASIGIATDIDGETRTGVPDLGADELGAGVNAAKHWTLL